MLSNAKLVGFILTKDYERARAFYEGKMEFEFVSHDPFALVLRAGQNVIRIVKMQDFALSQNTALGWEVGDMEAAVEWLLGRGVVLEKYPWVQDKERGI